jgi:hypothetical protein
MGQTEQESLFWNHGAKSKEVEADNDSLVTHALKVYFELTTERKRRKKIDKEKKSFK